MPFLLSYLCYYKQKRRNKISAVLHFGRLRPPRAQKMRVRAPPIVPPLREAGKNASVFFFMYHIIYYAYI